MEPGAPRRGREIRQAHARRQIHRPEEPRQADRQTVRGVREPAGHGPQGPALPFMAAQGTPPDAAQTTGDQARTELNRRVFRASHSRIPEIVEPARKIRRHGPDILRTTELGCSNARLEASDNRIKVTIRMAYGFHHANNPIALIMLRRGGLDIRPPQPRTQPTKTAEASFLCYPVKLRDGSSFSPFEPCRPTSPFADHDTITPRMAEFQRFRNSYCGTPR